MALTDLYSEKQIEILRRTKATDWFMLINHGAKRSGKTVINNDLFIMELRRVREVAKRCGVIEPMYILAGVSSKTIQNNILTELYNKYGITFKFDRHGSFLFNGVKIVQAYTGTIGGLAGIRGMTAFGAYVNEASLARKEVFTEIVSRCSGEGARVLVDTNPDHPEHWLLKDYIQNPSENILNFHFRLDDNAFLNDRYLANIKESTPSGVFYERDIEGKWVSGDGIVYADFDKNKHYFTPDESATYKSVFAGVDWGFKHHGAIVVVAESFDGKFFMLKEHAAELKDIDYWVGVAQSVRERYGDIPFYCDSARPEHVNAFRKAGIRAENARKERMAGIEFVAKLFKTDKLFICRDAKRFREEVYHYVWDKDTGDTIKMFDDVLDAIRYAVYSHHEGVGMEYNPVQGGL